MDTTRPLEIEPLSNRFAVHRLSTALLPAAIRLGLHPNQVTGLGLAFGLLAGLAYTQWTDWRFATLGFLLMFGWHVMDGLDGQLARATDQTSDTGRFLDGIADYATFIAVLNAIALTHDRPLLAFCIVWTGGAFHALQSQFYEGERATYIRRLAGRFEPVHRPATGGRLERAYNRGETMLGNRIRPFDAALAAADPAHRAAMIAAWRPRAARTLRLLSPVSANGHTIAIYLAVLAGEPLLYCLWEIVGLSAIALAAAHALRQAETLPKGAAGQNQNLPAGIAGGSEAGNRQKES
jgi:CDP-diacylglycerol---serine O-phosphatidyltransferase